MQSNPTDMAHYSSMTDPNPKKKSGVTLHFKKGKTRHGYKSASVETGHPEYGKVGTGRKIEPMLNKARAAKVEVVRDSEGKPYRAGHSMEHKEADTHTTKLHHTPSIPKRAKSSYETMKTKASTEAIRQKSGAGPKRRLPRVDWLKGRNKRTESGFGG